MKIQTKTLTLFVIMISATAFLTGCNSSNISENKKNHHSLKEMFS